MIAIQRAVQLLIVLACLSVLFNRFAGIETVDAQGGCAGDPPLSTNPTAKAWAQNSSVAVQIYEKTGNLVTSNAEFNAIDGAIREWNTIKVTGCSGVTFANASRTNAVWDNTYNYPFLNREVLVVRTNSNNEDGRFQEIGGLNGIKGGYAILHSDFTHDAIPQGKGPLYRVDNLAKHEVGHSFGIKNGENSSIQSAMGQNSFDGTNTLQITACDVDAHRRLYCPPTPTPTPTPYPTPYRSGGCDNPYENFLQGACPLYFSSDDTGYWCCEDGCNYQSNERVYDPSGLIWSRKAGRYPH